MLRNLSSFLCHFIFECHQSRFVNVKTCCVKLSRECGGRRFQKAICSKNCLKYLLEKEGPDRCVVRNFFVRDTEIISAELATFDFNWHGMGCQVLVLKHSPTSIADLILWENVISELCWGPSRSSDILRVRCYLRPHHQTPKAFILRQMTEDWGITTTNLQSYYSGFRLVWGLRPNGRDEDGATTHTAERSDGRKNLLHFIHYFIISIINVIRSQ